MRVRHDGAGNGGSLDEEKYFSEERVRYMKRMSKVAAWWTGATFAAQVLLWPSPMYGARFVFGKKLFVAGL